MNKCFVSLFCLAFMVMVPLNMQAKKAKQAHQENYNKHRYCKDHVSELAEFVARLAAFDEDEASAIHHLNNQINTSNYVISKDDVVRALERAEFMIAGYADEIPTDDLEQIAGMFNALIDILVEEDEHAMRDCGSSNVCNDDNALKVRKILCVLNKAIFCDIALFRDKAMFFKRVAMNDGLDIRIDRRNAVTRSHKAIALRVHDTADIDTLIAKKLSAKKSNIKNLHAKNADITGSLTVDEATIATLDVCDLTVSCTANIPAISVCDLAVTCTAFVQALEVLTTATIGCDLTVGCNIFMSNSTSPAVGNIYKSGSPFIHNFGIQNTFVGNNAGNFSMSGVQNSGFGVGALVSNTTGIINTALGAQALLNNTTGSFNTAAGFQALQANTIGNFNTALGQGTLFANTSGRANTGIGQAAMQNNTVGINNAALGFQALFSNTTGNNNVAIGFNALFSNTDAGQLTAVGTDALRSNMTGSSNVAVGSSALLSNTTGSNNIAIGTFALENNITGDANSAVGKSALFNNTTGMGNVALGTNALLNNVSGNNNIAIGSNALFDNTTGSSLVAVGTSVLQNNTAGVQNAALGDSALMSNTTGNQNAALGSQALTFNTSGSENTAAGNQTLFNNTIGAQNTALGGEALFNNTSGNNNTAVGQGTLFGITTGVNNTALGYNAGFDLATADSNNINIGNTGTAGDSGVIRIGTGGVHATNFQAGVTGVTVANNVGVLIDNVTGQLGTIVSSIRYKENVQDMKDASSAILALRPVTFHYKADASHAQQYGLIAEEVQKVMPGLVVKGIDGNVETVKYHDLAVLLLNELIKQHATIEEMKSTHAEEMADIKARLAALQAMN
jgi:hypothetical protein